MRTRLITNDMVKLVRNSFPYGKIEKYNLDRFVSVYIGRASVNRSADGKIHLCLDETFDSRYNRIWRDDVGEVLRKEFAKKEPELYEFTCKNFKALLKKVSDDEKETLAQKGLVHFMMGDSFYTIIRIVKPEGYYSAKDTKNDYYFDYDIEEFIDECSEDDDIVNSLDSSIKLF